MAFPNSYSVGITSLGYQVVWSTLATRSDVDVRRVFTDQGDTPHRHTDLFGVSLSWELDAPLFLDLLEKQHISIWSHQRNENSPIVFGGGPVLTANPEPFAPFFDAILLGEGESLIPIFINKMHETKGLSRQNRLKSLSQIEGVYIPSLYVPKYSKDGKLIATEPIDADIPPTVTKQTWRESTFSHSSVITPEAAWPNIHMVEVVRSCPELCRFCLASYLTLPFRTASLEEGLIPAVEKGLTVTNRIGLLGASVTQHPQFIDLLHWLNHDKFENIHLSVSSIRASTVSSLMTKILARRGSKSVTIAIESGSERLRKVVNKKLSENEIYSATRYAKEGGLHGLKFYGMVGLPTEEENDVKATSDLLLNLKRKITGMRFTLGVSSFVPKAHTPFQWHGVQPNAEKHLKLLSKVLKPKGIEVRPESYKWSLIQALLARSDRRLAPVIALVRGSSRNFSGWKRAYRSVREGDVSDNQPMPTLPSWEEVIHENWELSRVLPWAHINGPLKKSKLIEHHQDALNINHDLI